MAHLSWWEKSQVHAAAAKASGNVTAVGPVGTSPNANGATISGNTLTLEPADASNPGLVSTAGQSFAGTKTFNGGTIASGFSVISTVSDAANPFLQLTRSRVSGGGTTQNNNVLGFIGGYGTSASPNYFQTLAAGIAFVQDAAATSYAAPGRVEIRTAGNTTAAKFDSSLNCTITGSTTTKAVGTTLVDKGVVGATVTLNFTGGCLQRFQTTTATNCTISFTAPTFAGASLWIKIVAPASGTTPTLTWPTVKGGTMPTSVTLAKTRMAQLFYDGTDYVLMALSAEY